MNTETTNEARIEQMEVAFYEALEERDFESADQLITFLGEAGEYTKGIELAKKLCAAKLRLPADYGEEKAFGVVESQMDVITKGLIF